MSHLVEFFKSADNDPIEEAMDYAVGKDIIKEEKVKEDITKTPTPIITEKADVVDTSAVKTDCMHVMPRLGCGFINVTNNNSEVLKKIKKMLTVEEFELLLITDSESPKEQIDRFVSIIRRLLAVDIFNNGEDKDE